MFSQNKNRNSTTIGSKSQMVSYYRLNGLSDSSLNSYDLTVGAGSPTYGMNKGKLSSGPFANGMWLAIPANTRTAMSNLNKYTISIDCYFNSFQANTIMVDIDTGGTQTTPIQVYADGAIYSTINNNALVSPAGVITLNKWYNIKVTYDSAASDGLTRKIYVNNVLVKSGSSGGALLTVTRGALGNYQLIPSANLCILGYIANAKFYTNVV